MHIFFQLQDASPFDLSQIRDGGHIASMRVSELERLYAYSYWANRRLFAVVSRLTPEQFTQSVAGSYESIRNPLVHSLSAEWGWLDRCGGPPRGPKLNPDDYPTHESLVEEWNRVEQYMREFLARLDDAQLARNVEFKIGSGPAQSLPRGDLLLHGAVHGIHHRAQVALLLRMLGYAPGNFDMLFYYDEEHPASRLEALSPRRVGLV